MNLALLDGDVLSGPQVRELISLSVGDPTPAALNDVGHRYREDPAWSGSAAPLAPEGRQ